MPQRVHLELPRSGCRPETLALVRCSRRRRLLLGLARSCWICIHQADSLPYQRSQAVRAVIDPSNVTAAIQQDVSRNAEIRTRCQAERVIEIRVLVPELLPVHLLLRGEVSPLLWIGVLVHADENKLVAREVVAELSHHGQSPQARTAPCGPEIQQDATPAQRLGSRGPALSIRNGKARRWGA